MRHTIFVFAALLLSLTSAAPAHKFHFSFTEINQNQQMNSLEITIRIFTDDLENILKSEEDPYIRLGDERESPNANHLIENYLNEHFHLLINGQASQLRFLGKEVDYDITFCYLELPQVPPTNSMTIKNTILFESFEDQLNRVRVEFNGWSRTEDLVEKQPVMNLYN